MRVCCSLSSSPHSTSRDSTMARSCRACRSLRAWDDDVIAVALKRDGRERPRHPRVKGNSDTGCSSRYFETPVAQHPIVDIQLTRDLRDRPPRAFYARVCSRREMQIAVVATAQKLAVLCWHMISKGEDYAYQ